MSHHVFINWLGWACWPAFELMHLISLSAHYWLVPSSSFPQFPVQRFLWNKCDRGSKSLAEVEAMLVFQLPARHAALLTWWWLEETKRKGVKESHILIIALCVEGVWREVGGVLSLIGCFSAHSIHFPALSSGFKDIPLEVKPPIVFGFIWWPQW